MSVDLAKKVATKSNTTPATEYLVSQVASIKQKLTTKTMTPAGALNSAQHAMRNLSTKFRDAEINRSDPDFVKAAETLRDIALTALDQTEKVEPVDAVEEAVATKSNRDAE